MADKPTGWARYQYGAMRQARHLLETSERASALQRYQCLTCPFTTADPDAMRGHETYLDSHPLGWLGHGERHVMAAWPDGDDRLPWGVTGPTGWADANGGPRPSTGRGPARVCGDCWSILRPDQYEPRWSGEFPGDPCSMCGYPMGAGHRVSWAEIDAETAN